MEAGIPNLLIRTLSDPIESPFAHPPSLPEQDHHFSSSSSAVSFRKSGNGGGNTSPHSQSPRPLHLEVKEHKDTSPKEVRPSGGVLQHWAVEEREKKGAEERERERLLTLGIWRDVGQGLHIYRLFFLRFPCPASLLIDCCSVYVFALLKMENLIQGKGWRIVGPLDRELLVLLPLECRRDDSLNVEDVARIQ